MPTLIRYAECPPQPWKNGGGVTRELFRLPAGSGEAALRLSIAEITGGQPFSFFPGVDRIILQIDGPAMDLIVEGETVRLSPDAPFPFAGEAAVGCRLAETGTARDLNLMCRRGGFDPAMTVASLSPGETCCHGAAGDWAGLVALAPCLLDAQALDTGDLLVWQGANTLRAASHARLALWRATHAGESHR